MNKRNVIVNIKNAFGWKFHNVSKFYSEFERTDERIKQLNSDINIGFEKSQRSVLLKHLEALTRKNAVVDITIPLDVTPEKSPHHLDNSNDYSKFEKISFKEIKIEKIPNGRIVQIDNGIIHLKLDDNAMNKLFTRLYINFELYATFEDNVLNLKNENEEEIRLVIWGVINGKPIHY